MSLAFRALLQQVGSGSHTSKSLSREDAATATLMMLRQEATPAQIGAFMIAHRIKRPTAAELAGMLDAYAVLGPTLAPIVHPSPVTVLGIPYDGRSRTAPLGPITALLLLAAGAPVLMHGGDRMPTKAGIPLIEIWRSLGLPLDTLSLDQVQTLLAQTGFGLIYLPRHFPAAHGLVPYREEIGKRPPFATIELMWSPYAGPSQTVVGFVHPPTENLAQEVFALRGGKPFITVKGMEGSCDLPRSRTAIIGIGAGDQLERLLLHPRDFGFDGEDVPLGHEATLGERLLAVLDGQPSELLRSAIWNGGFYLWRSGICPSMDQGLAQAEALLREGVVSQTLQNLRQAVATLTLVGSGTGG